MSQFSAPAAEGPIRGGSRGNRRAAIRYRCAPATVGKVIAVDDREFQRAWIIDLSLRGVGMQLTRPVSAGQAITLLIRSNDGVRQFELSATVTHCDRVPYGDWKVGAEFAVPLTPENLDQLL